MRDTGIATRAHRKGLVVAEVAGWKERGGDLFQPVGSGNHHTAGAAPDPTPPPQGIVEAPSLGACTYGRGGPLPVPGPLCNVLQGRYNGPDPRQGLLDTMFVIAAGKANHGGTGVWRGVSGNSRFYGLEIEHVGTTLVHPTRLEAAARMHAAFLEGTDHPDPEWVWQHFQYATPLGRKIDFFDLRPWSPIEFRARIGWWIGRDADDVTDPDPEPPVVEDPNMRLVQGPNGIALYGLGWWRTCPNIDEVHALQDAGVPGPGTAVTQRAWDLTKNAVLHPTFDDD